MAVLPDPIDRLRERQETEPPFLRGATDGMLAVARELYDDPKTVTLPDGRRLGYAETGDPDGDPVLTFHGIPSGRLGAAVFDRIGRERGVRIVAPERPGVGVSDSDPDRELTDWPTDVVALLDALGIDTAPVFGISGGGPYALACGASRPDRSPRVAVCCGTGPAQAVGLVSRLFSLTARYNPWLIRAFLRLEALSSRQLPERTLERRANAGAPRDRELWRGEVGKLLVASVPAACRHYRTASFARDLQLFARDWGFDLGAIDVPVGLWYGRADQYVPISVGQYLFDAIPTAEAHFYPDLGHVSVIVENHATILDWLQRSVSGERDLRA